MNRQRFIFPVSLTPAVSFVQNFYFCYSSTGLTPSHGIHTRCWLVLNSAPHSSVVMKAFCRHAIHQTLLIYFRRISFMIQSTIPETSTSNAVVELMFISSGICGGQREQRDLRSTSTPSLRHQNISHHLLKVVKGLNLCQSRNAPTFVSGTSHRSSEVYHATTRVLFSSYTKSHQKSKSG